MGKWFMQYEDLSEEEKKIGQQGEKSDIWPLLKCHKQEQNVY